MKTTRESAEMFLFNSAHAARSTGAGPEASAGCRVQRRQPTAPQGPGRARQRHLLVLTSNQDVAGRAEAVHTGQEDEALWNGGKNSLRRK